MANEQKLEVEVKFLIPDLAAFREQVMAAGALVRRPRLFERNVRLDTADNTLMQRLELLRLRQDAAVILTFKGPPQQTESSEAKIREELEVEVSEWETAVHIFQRLGFEPKQVYEKYREIFQLGVVEVMLDEMPFGNFVELEGDEEAIKTAAIALGLDWSKRVLTNYLALMGQLKAYHNLPFDDLTFENFAGTSISIADVLWHT